MDASTITEYLHAEGITYRRDSNNIQPEFHFRINGPNCIANCRLLVDHNKLRLAISAGVRVRESSLSQFGRFVHLLDFALRDRKAFFDRHTGEVVFTHTITCGDSGIPREEFSCFVRQAVGRFDDIFPYLMLILYAGMDAERCHQAYGSRRSPGQSAKMEEQIRRTLDKLFADYKPPDPEF